MTTLDGVQSNSYLLVDLAALRANLDAVLRELPAGAALIPVVKDDAYGLGLRAVAGVLAERAEVGTLALASVSEGVALRRAGWQREILVMAGIPGRLAGAAVEHDLTVTVGRLGLAPLLARQAAARGRRVKVQLKLDTGLHRAGLAPGEELARLAAELAGAGGALAVTGVFSHFADTGDEALTHGQLRVFLRGVAQLEDAGVVVPVRHIAASAAFERYPGAVLDAVRVGRRLYLDSPCAPTGKITEVASWRGWVTQVRRLAAGSRLGYGAGLRLGRDTDVATVGVGYGDGLWPELAAVRAPVLVNGGRASLLACMMDQCFLDVTGLACAPDDEATFFGRDAAGNLLPAQEVAALAAGHEGCDLTACLGPRVARVYQGR